MGGCAVHPDTGAIRDLLTATHCNVSVFSETGYRALTGPHSIFPVALTAILAIYIAVLGYRLLLGLSVPSFQEIPMIGMKIGFILAMTLNWTVFQTFVLNLSARAPTEIASAIVGPQNAPLERLQAAYDAIRADEVAFAKIPPADSIGPNVSEAANGLSYASYALLASTGGLLAFSTIVTGVLASVGPLFIALFLFETGSSLFAGWLRAITASALVPMLCWITTIIFLATVEPRLDLLDQERLAGAPSPPDAIMICFVVYVFAAAQFALVVAALVVACTFRLPLPRRLAAATAPAPALQAPAIGSDSRIDRLVHALNRSSRPMDQARLENIRTIERPSAPYATMPGASPALKLGEDHQRLQSVAPRRVPEAKRP